jgi:hypothetical protein
MNLNSAYQQKILQTDNSVYNGRINIISGDENNTAIKIAMMEKIASKNKAVSYCDAMKGQWEDTSLSQAFFCKENIQIIQNAIRAGVYEKSEQKYVVSVPNIDNLQIIMRSTFLSFVEFDNKGITQQIEQLNQIVVDYCVKELYSASTSYVAYLQDQSSMYMPLKRESQHDRVYKQLQLKDWV